MKRSFAALAVVAALALPLTASAVEGYGPPFGSKFVDVALLRQLTMVGSIASTALAVGLPPLTWMTGMGDESVDYMVVAAWRYTGFRYPGEF